MTPTESIPGDCTSPEQINVSLRAFKKKLEFKPCRSSHANLVQDDKNPGLYHSSG